ncbi:hypothetical protein P4O66_015468, partial [Electrophorus voltai]
AGSGERGPGAEAGESYGTTSGDRDWYNNFQSSDLDSVDSYYPAERPSLILASLQGSRRREEPAERFFWGGALCMVQGRTLRSPKETSRTMRTGTRRWAPLGPTTPAWRIMGAMLTMERKGRDATSVCDQIWGPIVRRTHQWRWKRTLIGIFPPVATPKALRTMSLQHPRLRPGHAAPEQAGCPRWLAGRHHRQRRILLCLRRRAQEHMRLRLSLVEAKRQRHQCLHRNRATQMVLFPTRMHQKQDSRRYPSQRGIIPPSCVCVPVSVIVLVPVLLPAALLMLARGGLSGPPASRFAVGLGAAVRQT